VLKVYQKAGLHRTEFEPHVWQKKPTLRN